MASIERSGQVNPGDDASGRIAIFVSFSGAGGVERMIVNLANGMARQGIGVDLLLAKARGRHLQGLADPVRVIKLPGEHTFTNLFALKRHLAAHPPCALLAAKDRAIKTAILARWLAGSRVRLVGRLGTNVSAALEGKGRMRRALWRLGMRLFYRHADGLVCVSQGVADDVRLLARLPAERLHVVRNPVVTPDLPALAAATPDHPWLTGEGPPVILGVGRLTAQKDFATLIRAFARVRAERAARLLILGDGADRDGLLALARDLGVSDTVDLPGFRDNPYAFMARAAVFVLSSRWEGSPNVLTEALALGIPVVATDCPSGPREILRGGAVAPLVDMGDAAGLARAIVDTLDAPADADRLRAAVADYRVEHSVAGYLEALACESGRRTDD